MESLSPTLHDASTIASRFGEWNHFVRASGCRAISWRPQWLSVLADGLRHQPYCLEATGPDGRVVGLLPLCLVKSLLFGRFLVGLPYLNSGGLVTSDVEAGAALLSSAEDLANRLDVRYLELRHETPVTHPVLSPPCGNKVHMRLPLPRSVDELWRGLDCKVRNQIRKGHKSPLSIHWGAVDALDDFYTVFAHNMRDLGTPVFGKRLFKSILATFGAHAEIGVLRCHAQPVAAALLLHGEGVTEVPSASCLRAFNAMNANMLMYWHLLCRSVERGQAVFDFGRSSRDGNTYRFKKQWGAQPTPAAWQYYVRRGQPSDMRPESGKFGRAVALWKRLPVRLTRWLGPHIVRGIP